MIIITGASASGKSVAAKNLERFYGFKKAITTTTREKRIGEVDGYDYFFVSKDEFEQLIKDGKLVEYTLYNGNYYGCGKDQVDDNKVIVVDPNGLHSFLNLHNEKIVSFLLTCKDEIREERMRGRGDKEDKVKERLTNDKNDFDIKKIGRVDFVIATDDLKQEETVKKIYDAYRSILNK